MISGAFRRFGPESPFDDAFGQDAHWDRLGIDAVPHGFRSSFRDWASERTDHPREVVEAALAHTVRDQTEAAYARSDLFERRRHLMDDWAEYLKVPRGQVVTLGRR